MYPGVFSVRSSFDEGIVALPRISVSFVTWMSQEIEEEHAAVTLKISVRHSCRITQSGFRLSAPRENDSQSSSLLEKMNDSLIGTFVAVVSVCDPYPARR